MLKKEITYEDFDGDKVTETFYFNISKSELIQMEVEHKEGFQARMARIIKAGDNKTLIQEFKEIILMAYGVKSDDGRSFVKSDETRDAFSHTAAFEHLFMELALDANAGADFIIGVVPKDLAETVAKMAKEESGKQKSTAELPAERADAPTPSQ